ncbi:MAG: class I SAM-dependent methyltransferase [Pirellulales bacterium]|nr:class I SAM-dependent methyltransferase [Pirellulales bacterium]
MSNASPAKLIADQHFANDMAKDAYWSELWATTNPKQRRPQWLWNLLRRRRRQMYARSFRKLLHRTGLQSGDLLEIGCAPGATLEVIHEAAPHFRLHGIDYSQVGVEYTRKRFAQLGIDAAIHFGDVFTIELPRRYDIVMSAGVIEHFQDAASIVRHHLRFCKPGGFVVVTVPHLLSPVFHALVRRFDPGNLEIHNLQTLKLERLRELFVQAGLQQVQIGKMGAPRLHSLAAKGKQYGRIYEVLARSWNIVVETTHFPPIWHANLWALGRVAPQLDEAIADQFVLP